MIRILKIDVHYILWHYSRGFTDVFTGWRNILWFVWNYFSIGLLLRSLFSPWRALSEEKRGTGFDLAEYLSNLLINTIMRAVGFFIRLIFIVIGLIAWVIVFLTFPILIVFWVSLPFIQFCFMCNPLM